MPVRKLNKADIPVVAKMLAAAFEPDPLFKAFFPRLSQYPDDLVRTFHEWITVAYYDYSQILVVAYEEAGGEEHVPATSETQPLLSEVPVKAKNEQVLTGYAEWKRVGKGWQHVHNVLGRWDPRRLISPAISMFHRLRRWVFPSKAAGHPTPENPDPLTFWNFFTKIAPFSDRFFDAEHRQVHWSLEMLGIHPDHQNKGVGRELVSWGFNLARSDPDGDLPVVVIAAFDKEGFYQKVGFKELVGWISREPAKDGKDNPLQQNGVGGAAVLWTK